MSPVNDQGYEPEHSGADGDHHGSEFYDAGIEQSFPQWLSSHVPLR